MRLFDDFELPTTDIARVQLIAEKTKKILESGDQVKARRFFFFLVLEGYYSCVSGGMRPEVGHLMFRFSDHVSPEERASIKLGAGETDWLTLEDFRKDWQEQHPFIPEIDFTKKIEGGTLLCLPEAK